MGSNYVEQKSHEWHLERMGMFTNSELWKLIPSKKSKWAETIDDLTQTAKTYIEEKLWELKDGTYKEVSAWTLDYGNKHEPIAKQMLADYTGVALSDCAFTVHKSLFYYGGSCEIEAFVYKSVKSSAEIKCAATGRSHAENIAICKSADISKVMKENYPELYWQCQGHMEMQGTDQCLFSAYHPSKIGSETDFHVGILPRSQEDIDLAKKQLSVAFEYYKSYGLLLGVDVEFHLKNKGIEDRAKKDKIQADYEEAQKNWSNANVHETINSQPITIHDRL